jgi:two-component system CheB/CheR fusion protein
MSETIKPGWAATIPEPLAFPVVGIGASAGGIRALQDFVGALPPRVGAALVVIVHLDPDHASELSKVLAAKTSMRVAQVDRPTALEPDHIYVIAPNRRLFISDRKISSAEFDEPRGVRAPIDQFFRSLAEQLGDGFAVLMSGAGSDGALGVRAIKEAGGIILVQDPNEAEHDSMPRAAIAGGYADFVLPVRDLARQLVELVRTKEYLKSRSLPGDEEEILGRILAHVRVRTGHDFSQYKRQSLVRRLARRMQLVKVDSLAAYLGHLREHPEETQGLFADLLISVTTFFRDKDAFEQLAKTVIPAILEWKTDGAPIRIWVPGCATGEEAYSLAILLLEEIFKHDIRPDIQIFASDLDTKALAVAREGCYPKTISADVSEERLRRFFVISGEDYRIKREVRDNIVFAQHSVLKDPPFSRIDLISCRNLLIYINRDSQQKVLATFHYALVPNGYLFIGSSETADHPENLFRVVDRARRIYQSTGRPAREAPFPMWLSTGHWREPSPPPVSLGRTNPYDAPHHHLQAIREYAPPSVLVDELHRVLHISEGAGAYMSHPAGAPTVDATDVVRPELRAELRILLHYAFEQKHPNMSLPIAVDFNGAFRHVCLQVAPVLTPGQSPRALILFIEGGPAQAPSEREDAQAANSDVTAQRLQEELLATRGNLKIRSQQFEAATENLRAANEELQSINEEYRSTAEELETSREELQSMNEELQTLNNELKIKLDAVSRAHNDLENLMIATDVGTLFLDTELKIKRFTPRMRDWFNINTSDEGRHIADFTHRLNYPDFDRDLRVVMERNTPIEREIRNPDGQWFLMRLRPYLTLEGGREGVVATFIELAGYREQSKTKAKPKRPSRQPRKTRTR